MRRAKSKHGVDLADVDENSPLIRLNTDPLVLSDVIWALYEPKLVSSGIASTEALEDSIMSDQVDDLRESVVDAVTGFFPLVKTVSTAMQKVQDGDIDLTNPPSPPNKTLED